MSSGLLDLLKEFQNTLGYKGDLVSKANNNNNIKAKSNNKTKSKTNLYITMISLYLFILKCGTDLFMCILRTQFSWKYPESDGNF